MKQPWHFSKRMLVSTRTSGINAQLTPERVQHHPPRVRAINSSVVIVLRAV